MSFDLRAERMNRGLTQARLARILEVDRGTVIRLERGGKPMADTALRIAQWLGKQPADIWPAEPDRSAA